MLHKISKAMAKKLAMSSEPEKEEIYVYGLELIITTFLGLASIVLVSGVLSEWSSAWIFTGIFVPLRLCTGGYHADTYGKCFVISNLSYLSLLIIKKLTEGRIPMLVWLMLLAAACWYIGKNAPVLHRNQMINEQKQKRNRKTARVLLIVDVVVSLGFSLYQEELMVMTVLSVCLIAGLMARADKRLVFKKGEEEFLYEHFGKNSRDMCGFWR